MLLAADAAVAKPETMSFIDQEHKLLIDGQWVPAESGKTFEVNNPATGVRLCVVERRAEHRPPHFASILAVVAAATVSLSRILVA